MVSNAAHEQGMKVALSGVGADEIFGGYLSFQDIPTLVRRTRAITWIPGLSTAFRIVSAPIVRAFTNPKYAGLLEMGNGVGTAYLLRRGMFLPWELPSLLDGEIVKEGLGRLQPLIHVNTVGTNRRLDTHLRIVQLELQNYLRNQLLRDTDWASMFSSLEVRTPFVDAALLEGLVAHANTFGWPTKELMAGTPKQALPEAVLARPKTGFVVPRPVQLRERSIGREPPQRTWAREVYLTYVLNGQPC
jgi:asparagine synthase (glutamine-hydrolysing)